VPCTTWQTKKGIAGLTNDSGSAFLGAFASQLVGASSSSKPSPSCGEPFSVAFLA
ncbi:unnamed protein product, partial [Amoebophrya sp. A25]